MPRHMFIWPHPQPDWVSHVSVTQLRILAFSSVIPCFLLLQFVRWALAPNWHLSADDLVSDGAASLVIGYLFGRVLTLSWQRRRTLLQQVGMIGEMNHHIRNALQTINYTAHQTHDPTAIAAIQEASDRIQWALREILPAQSAESSPVDMRVRRT